MKPTVPHGRGDGDDGGWRHSRGGEKQTTDYATFFRFVLVFTAVALEAAGVFGAVIVESNDRLLPARGVPPAALPVLFRPRAETVTVFPGATAGVTDDCCDATAVKSTTLVSSFAALCSINAFNPFVADAAPAAGAAVVFVAAAAPPFFFPAVAGVLLLVLDCVAWDAGGAAAVASTLSSTQLADAEDDVAATGLFFVPETTPPRKPLLTKAGDAIGGRLGVVVG